MKKYLSHAKINIGLRIVGKRPDGFHTLESVFQEISLHDEIYVRRKESGIRIWCNWQSVPTDERNLCYRVFQLFAEKYGVGEGVDIELRKNIPVGSGLGGGSSNAATCIKAFSQMFHLGLSLPEMIRLAAQVGSDVPFFIVGKTALVKGRGEVVVPIRFLSDYHTLLVLPKVQLSTAEIYKKFEMNLTKYKRHVKFEAVISGVRNLGDLSRNFYNDLEQVARAVCPELAGIRERLIASGAAYVSLSGSGSAMYGLYQSKSDLEAAKEVFSPDFRVYVAQPVT